MESTTWLSDLEVDDYSNLMRLCTEEDVHFDGELKGCDKIRREENSPYSNGSRILSFGAMRDEAYKKTEEQIVVAEMNLPFYMASKDGDGEMSFGICKRSNNNNITSPRRRRTSSHSQHHIIAERKRREKLSLRFAALSSLVPGLKKMDKASVLGEAVKYVKQLQERVKSLEEETMNRCVESVVTVKKSRILAEDDENSSVDDSSFGELLPEIEVRVSENNVLVKIHCVNRQGNYSKILCEIQKRDLTIVSTTAVKFGNYAIDITIVAEIKPGCVTTVKDLAKELRLTLRN